MWPFKDKKKILLSNLSASLQHKFSVPSKAWRIPLAELLQDDYILGYLMGECFIQCLHSVGKLDGEEFAGLMLGALSSITEVENAVQALKRSAVCTIEENPDYLLGRQRGMNAAFILIGKKDRENEPEVMVARMRVPETTLFLRKVGVPEASLTSDFVTYYQLEKQHFSDFIEEYYKKK